MLGFGVEEKTRSDIQKASFLFLTIDTCSARRKEIANLPVEERAFEVLDKHLEEHFVGFGHIRGENVASSNIGEAVAAPSLTRVEPRQVSQELVPLSVSKCVCNPCRQQVGLEPTPCAIIPSWLSHRMLRPVDLACMRADGAVRVAQNDGSNSHVSKACVERDQGG